MGLRYHVDGWVRYIYILELFHNGGRFILFVTSLACTKFKIVFLLNKPAAIIIQKVCSLYKN